MTHLTWTTRDRWDQIGFAFACIATAIICAGRYWPT